MGQVLTRTNTKWHNIHFLGDESVLGIINNDKQTGNFGRSRESAARQRVVIARLSTLGLPVITKGKWKMENSTIQRRKTADPFCRIPNDTLQSKLISFKAKGILAYLLSKPDSWQPQVRDIVNNSADGRASVLSGLMELRKAGYAQQQRIVCLGKVVRWVLLVSDSPQFMITKGKTVTIDEKANVSPESGFPEVEKPELEKPEVENRHLSNTKGSKTKGSNTDGGANVPELFPMETRIAAEKPWAHQFIAAWCESHQRFYGEPYKVDAADARQLKLLRDRETTLTAAEAADLAAKAWLLGDTWLRERAATVAGFCTGYNKIRAAVRSSPDNSKALVQGLDAQINKLYKDIDANPEMCHGEIVSIQASIQQLQSKKRVAQGQKTK